MLAFPAWSVDTQSPSISNISRPGVKDDLCSFSISLPRFIIPQICIHHVKEFSLFGIRESGNILKALHHTLIL